MVASKKEATDHGFLVVKFKSSLRKFYGRHHDLVNSNGISVSQMCTSMLYLSYSQSNIFLIHDLTGTAYPSGAHEFTPGF
jgi:hypothetical protein